MYMSNSVCIHIYVYILGAAGISAGGFLVLASLLQYSYMRRLYIYTYMHIYIYIYTHIKIYIYMYRERDIYTYR